MKRMLIGLIPLALSLAAVAAVPPEVGPPPHSEQGSVAYQDGLLAIQTHGVVLVFDFDSGYQMQLDGLPSAQAAIDAIMAAAASGPIACATAADQACHGHVHHVKWSAASDGHAASCSWSCYRHAVATVN